MAGESGRIQRHSRKMAVCGLMAALGAVFLTAGALPFAAYCAPVLAMLTLLPVQDACGHRWALGVYAVISLLGLLLSPETEAAVVFLILGYYPILRHRLNRLPGPLRLAAKLAVFNGAVALACAAAIILFRLPLAAEAEAGGAVPLLPAMALLGNATFLLLDRALGPLEAAYRRRWKKLLFQ